MRIILWPRLNFRNWRSLGMIQSNLSFLILLLISITAGASTAHAAERNYSIGSFDNIQIEGDLIVTITTGKGPSASASGTFRQLDALRFKRNGRTLRIQMNQDSKAKRVEDIRAPALQIFITTSQLSDISLRGNGVVNVNMLSGRKSLYTILGSGMINAKQAQIDTLSILIRGGGNVSIDGGKINKMDAVLNGFGSINAPKLVTKILNIEHQGPANTIISVSDVANIINNGTGKIEILGKANCLIKSIGSGTILCDNSEFSN